MVLSEKMYSNFHKTIVCFVENNSVIKKFKSLTGVVFLAISNVERRNS